MHLKRRLLMSVSVFLFIFILCVVSYKTEVSVPEIENLYSRTSKEVVVAVIDTGLNLDESINEERVKWIELDSTDDFGHGTEIVSLILNNTTESVKVMPVKVTNSEGTASMQDVCNGIRKATENGADIINISMNTAFYTDATELEELINELYEKGIYTVVSAGNDSENTKYLTPANIDSAIVVSAMTSDKQPYYYSNYGETVDFSALGMYEGNLGTSFASAYVTSLCAQLLASGVDNIEEILVECSERVIVGSDNKYYGLGYLEWDEQYTGESRAETEIYIGGRSRTQNEKTFDILELDWKSISKEELDAVIGETAYRYVGLFISKLTETEIEELKAKSQIVNTNVGKLSTVYDEVLQEYIVTDQTEVNFIDYCIEEYENEKEKLFITSDWDCRTVEAIFYISSPDRQKIYKYSITGLYGHAWCIGTAWQPAFTDADLGITYSVYKDEVTTYSFTQPIPTRLSTFIPSVRATRVDYYKADGTFLNTGYSWNYIGEGVDDACPYVGISIVFGNYTNKKIGYHNSENAISMYNAELGIGTSTTEALIYTYPYEFSTHPASSCLNFSTTELGSVKYWYNGVFNSGYNMYNATTVEESLSYYLTGQRDNIYISTGQTSINDTTGTFTMNAIPWIGFGTQWYGTFDNVLYTDSDIPEIVFNLAPNTYTVYFDGNGATGGSTASQAMTYDVGYHLNANGFTRTGYTFAGWSTSLNGPVQYNDGHYVSNMTATNGGTVTLYAQWKSSGHTLAYNANGGTGAPASQTIKVGITNKISSTKPTRTGYTFKYWTTTSYDLTNDYHYGVSQPTNGSYIKRVWMNYISSSVMEILVYADNTASVEVPTWTTLNGQDDLVWHKLNKGSWTAGGQKFNFGGWIYISEHNGEVGEYIHHAYAFNSAGGTLESKAFRNHGFIYHPNDTYAGTMSGGTQILYAQWKANAYKIAFNGNGATGGSTASINCTYNTTATLTANGFSRTGYTFTGWNTKANGTGVSYADKASVKNLTYTNGATVTLYAQWKANTYKIAFNGNGATGGSTASMNCTYNTTATLTANGFSRTGYTFTGWNTKANGTGVSYADKASVKNLTYTNGTTITLYAQWTPNKYTVHFDANGGEGVMEDVVLSYDLPENLPYNSFTRNNGYGDSLFLGWNIVPDTREVLYRDGAEVVNMTEMDGSTLTLYAVWDDCPWIIAEDLYYTLEEARSGLITYDELMNHASAEDREAGGIVQPGIDEGRGTSFVIIDYAETDFTQFEHDGSVTETYRVIDSIGNEYKKMITVYIVDTATAYINPEGTTRFINEKYYYESYENGGLEDNSIWKTDPEYVQVIEQAFENSRNNTPIMSFYFTHEEILAMKEFVRVNGIGNFKSEDALQRFYEQFMEPNIMN